MKFNRNKTGLVVAAMILALTLILSGCATPADNTDNKTPDFLEVGGFYLATAAGAGHVLMFTVVEIRRDGWILAEITPNRYWWINTTQLVWLEERQKPQ